MKNGWPCLTGLAACAVSLADVSDVLRVLVLLVSALHGLLALKNGRRRKSRRVQGRRGKPKLL